ncbi:MAG: bifunctional enoyl-CoA hydratase/phosphate acetyltransferase [Pseudomonadota bacterium]
MTTLENTPFDAIVPGQSAELRRLCTEDDFYAFAATTGNHNPLHLSDHDGDGDGSPEAIAPALFVGSLISAVLGTMLPGAGTVYLSQSFRFHNRAAVGDELLAAVEVLETGPERSVKLATTVRRPADGALLLDGEAWVKAPEKRLRFEGVDVPGLLVERHRHFDALLAQAEPLDPIPTAVVAPEDPNSLAGALLAMRHTIITPILVGAPGRIAAAAKAAGASTDGIEIVAAATHQDAAHAAVDLVADGRARAVMKGHLHTDELLRACLRRDRGLRAGRRFTHVFVMDVPGLAHPLLVTDAAINIAPDLATKVDIVQNAIDLARAIGIEEPKVGVLSAVETVNTAIQSSVDAALIAKMADRGQIKGGLVDGPLAMDNAIDIKAARTKGIGGAVAGMAEVLVVPGIDAGNMLAKQLTYVSHAEAAGVVLGASVPVILTSRADDDKARLASCAVAALHSVWMADQASRSGY